MHTKIAEGIRLFNSRKFFEAHEALEEVWLKSEGKQKFFLHGLIQVAAAFHHYTKGNAAGFRSLLEKGTSKLAQSEDCPEGIDLSSLLSQLDAWRDAAKTTHPSASSDHLTLPQITVAQNDAHCGREWKDRQRQTE